jgi:hypothetical protein
MSDPRDNPNDGSQPGVMGDQTEEQNLGQPGHPENRITEEEVNAAFGGEDDEEFEDEEEEEEEEEEEDEEEEEEEEE